jgi:hypothetical protein
MKLVATTCPKISNFAVYFEDVSKQNPGPTGFDSI